MNNVNNEPVDKFVDVGERLMMEFKVIDEAKANRFIAYITQFAKDWGVDISYFCTGDEVFGLSERQACNSLLAQITSKLNFKIADDKEDDSIE